VARGVFGVWQIRSCYYCAPADMGLAAITF